MTKAERLRDEGEYVAALKEARAACAAAPSDSQAWRVRAELEELLGDEAAARRSMTRALAAQRLSAASNPTPEETLDLGSVAENAGRLDEAQEAFSRAAEAGSSRARLELARLRLWAGRPEEAARLALGSGEADGRRIAAGAAVLRARPAEALPLLDALLAESPQDLESRSWRGEAYLALGRAQDAFDDYDHMLHRTDGFLSGGAGYILSSLALGRPVRPFDLWVVSTQAPPDLREGLLALKPGDTGVAPALRRLLAAVGGNRTRRKTRADGRGGVFAYAPQVTAYDVGDSIQARLRAQAPEAVLAAFARWRRREPREPQALTFRGEVLLWLGRADDAEKDFLAALELDPGLRWPNVGLAGVETLRGRPEEALERCRKAVALGARDRSWRVWAGEACLALGRAEEAVGHLRAALAATPRRVSAYMLLALAEHAAGRREAARLIAEGTRRRAPRFFKAAAAAAAGGGRGFGADLRAGLRMMRGNRSSWLWTWFDARGRLRNLEFAPQASEAPGA